MLRAFKAPDNYNSIEKGIQSNSRLNDTVPERYHRRCLTMCICLGLFLCTYAQKSLTVYSDTLDMRFRLDSVNIDMTFDGNAARWRVLEEHFTSRYANYPASMLNIDIYAGASPEGTPAHNRWLGLHRGLAVKDLLIQRLNLKDSRITVHNEAARWDRFRDMVEKSSEPWRDEVLQIIDMQPSTEDNIWDHRERKLRALHNGEVWPVLIERYLSPLRSGATTVISTMMPCDTVYIRDTIYVMGAGGMSPSTDSVRVAEPDTIPPPPNECWRPLLAVKTNMLFDAALTPNLEVEVPIGWTRWSVMAEWWGPWYCWHGPNLHNRCYELLTLGVEARCWLSRREPECPRLLRGHFLGIYAAGGKYDIQPGSGNHEGWQGEFTSFGLTYGYTCFLKKHWRLEFSLSAGYVGGPQRYYHGMFNDSHLIWQRTQTFRFIGPTKAKVSIAYLLGGNVKKKGGRK